MVLRTDHGVAVIHELGIALLRPDDLPVVGIHAKQRVHKVIPTMATPVTKAFVYPASADRSTGGGPTRFRPKDESGLRPCTPAYCLYFWDWAHGDCGVVTARSAGPRG